MDVRIWGPDGWKLLHSIVENYPDHPSDKDKAKMLMFFGSVKYVLPCIYCRRSFTEYGEKLPITDFLQSKNDLTSWIYQIHEFVNNKLRGQDLPVAQTPSYTSVREKYRRYIDEVNDSDCKNMDGWTFIYCILFNFPKDPKEQEDFTVERHAGYIIFLESLIDVLPFIKAKNILQNFKCRFEDECLHSETNGGENLQKLAYEMESAVKNAVRCTCLSYGDRCKEIDSYRAKCGQLGKAKTCRIRSK